MWDVIVLVPDHCLSIYFTSALTGLALDSFVIHKHTTYSRHMKYLFYLFSH